MSFLANAIQGLGWGREAEGEAGMLQEEWTLISVPWKLLNHFKYLRASLHSSVCKESACNAGESSSSPGSGRSPGEGNGNPLQYSCLQNPMERRVWQATVCGVTRAEHDLQTKPPPPQTLLGEEVWPLNTEGIKVY